MNEGKNRNTQSKPAPSVSKSEIRPPAPAKINVKDIGKKPFVLTNPADVIKFGQILKNYIVSNNLSCKIQGKDYVLVEGWKFAAMSFGITAICKKPVRLEEGKVVYNLFEKYSFTDYKSKPPQVFEKERVYYSGTDINVVESIRKKREPFRIALTELYLYECEVDLISMKTGEKIGYGYAVCSNAETIKSSFDQYAIASMSQTRAIGKAVKNLLGFIMNNAGFETTPAEEMEPTDGVRAEDGQAETVTDVKGLDMVTEQIIKEAASLDELSLIWDKNEHLHNVVEFTQAMSKRKSEIKQAKGASK